MWPSDLVDALDRQLRLEGLAEQQLVEGAFEFAAAAGHGAGDVCEDLLGNVEVGILAPGAVAARSLSMPRRMLVVGRRHFERDAALEARAHARLERFQLRRRPVGRDHHLLGAVEQHVEQVAELVLDRLALQELHVVDDQEVDVAQLLLERQRVVVADRGGEAPHEVFGRQVDDARLAGSGAATRAAIACSRCVLPRPTRGMEEQRVEAHGARLPTSATVAAAASATRLDGPSTKDCEGVARVERRAEHALLELGIGGAAAGRRRARSARPAAIVPSQARLRLARRLAQRRQPRSRRPGVPCGLPCGR